MYMYMCMHTHTYMCMREAAAATAGCCVHLMRLTGRVIVRGLIVTRRAAVLGATAEQQQQQRHARGRGVEPVKTHGAREEDVGPREEDGVGRLGSELVMAADRPAKRGDRGCQREQREKQSTGSEQERARETVA